MPKTKTPKTQSKSDFIRSQPATLSAADVVAKAKTAGIKIADSLVYKVRRRAKAKKSTKAKAPAAAKAATPSKAAFIRSLPKSMSVKDVVAAAKKRGIQIADTYVYWARSQSGKKQNANRATTTRTAPSVKRPIATAEKAEELLRAVAAEIGLGRAMDILAGERARVRAVIGD
jgi:hypothetical protein